MTKLDETLQQHPEMSAVDVTRVEVAKVVDPNVRTALEAIVDLAEMLHGDGDVLAVGSRNAFTRIDAIDVRVAALESPPPAPEAPKAKPSKAPPAA